MDTTAPAAAPATYKLDMLKAHQRYKLNGRIVPGVTTMLGILDKPGLLKWAWNCGRDGIDIEKVRDHAGNIGTVAHALVEAWLRKMRFDESDVAPNILSQALSVKRRFVEWWEENGLALEHSELQMVSPSMEVGGTADIIATRPNGRRILIDVKTGKAVYREAHLQVAAYGAMFQETRLAEALKNAPPGSDMLDVVRQEGERAMVHELWIIRCGKGEKDDFEAVEVKNADACIDAFRCLAQTYHALQRVGRT
jgi:hypothetical protein